MIGAFASRPVAPELETGIASVDKGGGMVRSGYRATERRRGVISLITAVAAALPACREARVLRERFEAVLSDVLDAREVELRDGPPMACPPEDGISIEVRSGDFTLGAIDALFYPGLRRFDAWDQQVLDCARDLAALVLTIDRAQRSGLLGAGGVSQAGRRDGAAPIVGSSEGIRAVRDRMERVAATDFTVLIEGESGVGKELVARQIHEISPRRAGPFVAVNCAAIVETLLEAELFGIEDRTATGVRGRIGKFEHAHDGTLFLDEVGDLSHGAQAKLLRAIQEMSIERVGAIGARRVDTRIIAATNQPLSDLVASGRFRLDLYYRLHGVEIAVPPLRERPDDIIELAEYFLARHREFRKLRLSQASADALVAYRWPGNVRELERVMEHAIALADGDCLRLDDLPPSLLDGYAPILAPSFHDKDSMRAWGSRYARMVFERCDENKRRTCRELGISYHTLNAYLRYRPEARRARRTASKRAGLPPANRNGAGGADDPQRYAPDQSGGLRW
jgi:DNA-binding NtrC family response regulator